MKNCTNYSELMEKIPMKNLLRIHRNLCAIGESGEKTILSSLEKHALVIFDEDYQIPVRNQEDYLILRGILKNLAQETTSS